MHPLRPRSSLLPALAVLLSIAIAGCSGSKETLQPIRSGNTPPGIDLSGSWVMQDDFEAMQQRLDRAIGQTDGVDERRILQGMLATEPRQRSSGRAEGGLVFVFLENGRNLRITQTATGLFIAFDRSVVEEYRFDEMRMVRTGGAVAQRVSGWLDDGYVIETLDEQGMKLTERYRLDAARDQLTREVTLRSAEKESVTIVQTFVRRNRGQ